MINTKKIIQICNKANLCNLPALKQLIKAQDLGKNEDLNRIGNNLISFLKEEHLWKNSSFPPQGS